MVSLLVPHSEGIVGHSRGLAAPVVALHCQGFDGMFLPPASGPPTVFRPCPMVAPRSHVFGDHKGSFPGVSPAVHRVPKLSPSPISFVPHVGAIRVSLYNPAPPCSCCLIFHCQSLRVGAASLSSLVCNLLLACPPHIVLLPCSVASHLVLVHVLYLTFAPMFF